MINLKLAPRSAVTLKGLSQFPASVVGTAGISIANVGGVYTFRLQPTDFGILAAVPVSDQPNTYFLAHNVSTGILYRIGYVGLAQALADATLALSDHTRLAALSAPLAKLRRVTSSDQIALMAQVFA